MQIWPDLPRIRVLQLLKHFLLFDYSYSTVLFILTDDVLLSQVADFVHHISNHALVICINMHHLFLFQLHLHIFKHLTLIFHAALVVKPFNLLLWTTLPEIVIAEKLFFGFLLVNQIGVEKIIFNFTDIFDVFLSILFVFTHILCEEDLVMLGRTAVAHVVRLGSFDVSFRFSIAVSELRKAKRVKRLLSR